MSKIDLLLAALNRIADAVEDQTQMLRNVAATLDESVEVKQETLEYMKEQDARLSESQADADEDNDFDPFNSNCDCQFCEQVRKATTKGQ